MLRPRALAIASLLLLPTTAQASDRLPGPIDSANPTKPVVDGATLRSSFVMVDPVKDLAADAVASEHISNILFVNRCVGGCTIQPGVNDARANTSSIVNGISVLSEFQWSDQVWEETMACIRDVYAPYNVQVVDVDPGDDTFHHEAILAGRPSEIGVDSNFGGIAPTSCAPLNNVISYTFANHGAGNPLYLCSTVAQESAHSYGLPNHVFDCSDPMTYLPSCGKKYFRNKAFPCGEYEPRRCICSASSQNSHLELRNVFGDGTPPPPPTVSIAFPTEGREVSSAMTVHWQASDPRKVDRAEIWVNGTMYGEIEGNDWTSDPQEINYDLAISGLPQGILDLEVRAYNDLGSEGIASVTVQNGEPCQNTDGCFDFQICDEGRCLYPAPDRSLGEPCDIDQNCLEGACGKIGNDGYCAAFCNPAVDNCADGFECRRSDTGPNVCWPEKEEGGCCSVAGSKREPLPWFGAAFFFIGIMLIRRRAVAVRH